MREVFDSQVGEHTRCARGKKVIRRRERPIFLPPILANDVLQAAIKTEIESPAGRITDKIGGQTPVESKAATLVLEDITEDP